MPEKLVLVRARTRAQVQRALDAGFTRFFLDAPVDGVGHTESYVREGDRVTRGGKRVGAYVEIRSSHDEHAVRALKGKIPLVVVEPTNWKVIPLENLVAALGGRTKLWAVAKSPDEARLFLATLERGVDGVVVEPRNAKDLAAYRGLVEPARPPIRLVSAKVSRIEPVGVGERVCVDTVNLFQKGEGLLVGNTGAGFFLVAAECEESSYVAARPFRVNAGAVHAYVWNGDKTLYLSEVRSGKPLEAVDPKGRRRQVVVGRAKVETRPLVLVEARFRGGRAHVILQNAETIRLVAPGGSTISVADLKVGHRVLLLPETGGRHFGMKVKETIREV